LAPGQEPAFPSSRRRPTGLKFRFEPNSAFTAGLKPEIRRPQRLFHLRLVTAKLNRTKRARGRDRIEPGAIATPFPQQRLAQGHAVIGQWLHWHRCRTPVRGAMRPDRAGGTASSIKSGCAVHFQIALQLIAQSIATRPASATDWPLEQVWHVGARLGDLFGRKHNQPPQRPSRNIWRSVDHHDWDRTPAGSVGSP